jgi:hypothetical protein
MRDKQIALKPFDLVLAAKVFANNDEEYLLSDLATDFGVSVSTIHGALMRCETARLLSRSAGSIRSLRPAFREFAIHGAKYTFPAVLGRATRGIPTSIGSPFLALYFDKSDALVPVWPHPEGSAWGFELVPLHPGVPNACLRDQRMYKVLAFIDAIRVGAAREREIARQELEVL